MSARKYITGMLICAAMLRQYRGKFEGEEKSWVSEVRPREEILEWALMVSRGDWLRAEFSMSLVLLPGSQCS